MIAKNVLLVVCNTKKALYFGRYPQGLLVLIDSRAQLTRKFLNRAIPFVTKFLTNNLSDPELAKPKGPEDYEHPIVGGPDGDSIISLSSRCDSSVDQF